MNTITITVGRNVPTAGRPIEMDAETWGNFQGDIDFLLFALAGEVYVRAALGRGEWHGVGEDNATWVAAVMDDRDLPKIEQGLEQLAAKYKQDAIAFTVGKTTLVTA